MGAERRMAGPVVDTHFHVWRVARTPWLQGPEVPRIFGAHGAIRRDYLMPEYLADAAPVGVTGAVFVQANVAAGEELEEVRWVASLAARHGWPGAITAFADLSSPDVAATLDALLEAGPVRAVRQQLHWHAKPTYRFAARPDVFKDPDWRRGLTELGRRNLMFELQVFPGQMDGAAALLSDFPDLRFILLHAGMLEDRSEAGWAEWRRGIACLAAAPNCLVKLSGLGTFLRRCSLEDAAPVVRRTVDAFGPERCMFGSNFPIEKIWTGYAQLLGVMREALSAYRAAEQQAILHDTALRAYQLQPAGIPA